MKRRMNVRMVKKLFLAIVAGVLSASASIAVPSGTTAALYDDVQAEADSVAERIRRLSPMAADDVVWLARCIYSESDRAHEQRLVAWVVRNRVETQYRGSTYRDVILEARQFSAFNEPTRRRERILGLTPASMYGPWRTALDIALDVYQAPASERPFARTVRHFYSPISMRGGLRPHWADSGTEIPPSRLGVDPFRFRFFDDVDESAVIASTDESDRHEVADREDGGGFLLPVGRRSGRVARPLRPTIRRSSVK